MYIRRQDQTEYRPQMGGFSFFPPVIKTLLVLNVVIFLLQLFLEGSPIILGNEPIYHWFGRQFFLMPLGGGFRIWQLISYMFLHGGWQHILLNMFMLWMFGMEVENTWGSRKFAIFYLVCGLAAGLANLFIAPMFTDVGPTLGASGSVYGVLVAFAMLFPNRYVFLLFPPIPIKAKYMIAFWILMELWQGIGSADNIAHIAHLGGAVIGALWVILDSRGVIDRLISTRKPLQFHDPYRQSNQTYSRPPVQDAEFTQAQYRPTRKTGDAEFDEYQKKIDEILDKISKYGYAGLTELEKQILLDASKKIHPDKN